MRNISLVALVTSLLALSTTNAQAAHRGFAEYTDQKEWTFLVYLNGNNSLDSFGPFNINQMEQVGSTDKINIVVQWASLAKKKTQRLYVTKDNNTNQVTSKVIQDLGSKVDMGDWHTLADFLQWGAKNFPANHYFVDVWDHGSGWHALHQMIQGTVHQRVDYFHGSAINVLPYNQVTARTVFHASDISWDDNTGHAISIKELGEALAIGAQAMGHKIDLYGSDACLMAMAEVATEVADSVQIFAGSEEVEPGAGWPYDQFLAKLAANPTMSAADLGKTLTTDYVKSYEGGSNGTSEVTFSAYDLSQMDNLNGAINALAGNLASLKAADYKKVLKSMKSTQVYAFADYGDLGNFADNLLKAKIKNATLGAKIRSVKSAMGSFVIANADTNSYSRSQGLAIWLPDSKDSYNNLAQKYKDLKFTSVTHWGDALQKVLGGH